MSDEDQTQQQWAVAYAHLAAREIHAAQQVEQELRGLLNQAIHLAAERGVPGVVIAEATGVTEGRVSQILADQGTRSNEDFQQRLSAIVEWGDIKAVRENYPTFIGKMSYPPYPKRRARQR